MITDAITLATLPATDMARARAFYEGTLGLRAQHADEAGVTYELGRGSSFLVYPSIGQPSGAHTQMALMVEDLDSAMAELRGRGVAFEAYDFDGFDQDSQTATFPDDSRAAWFKDSEGNILGVTQLATPI